MMIFLIIIHVIVCAAVVLVVLLQQGEGANIGATFGSGGSQTIFGSRGSGNFLTKLTAVAGAVFMVTSILLAKIESRASSSSIVKAPAGNTATMPPIPQKGAPFIPAAPAGKPAFPAAPAAPAPGKAATAAPTQAAKPGASQPPAPTKGGK